MPGLESITPAKLAHLAALPTEAGRLAQVIAELEAAGLIAATPERLLLLTAQGRRRQRGAA